MTGHRPSDSEANSLSQRVPLTPWMIASGMDWSALTAGLSPEILPKGGILYQQGSPSDEMFLIVEGRVRLECCHSNGKNRAIYIVSNGVTMGEAGAMFGGTHDFQAVAVSRCTLYRISAPLFRRRAEASPALAIQVLQIAARKGQILATLLTQDSFLGVQARMSGTLLRLAGQYGAPRSGGTLINLRFTHQEMADLLGVSRVSVSQCFQEFTRRGFLQKQGRFYLISDTQGLEQLLQQA